MLTVGGRPWHRPFLMRVKDNGLHNIVAKQSKESSDPRTSPHFLSSTSPFRVCCPCVSIHSLFGLLAQSSAYSALWSLTLITGMFCPWNSDDDYYTTSASSLARRWLQPASITRMVQYSDNTPHWHLQWRSGRRYVVSLRSPDYPE